MTPTPEYYIDKAGEHRWRVRAGNGEIIQASTEGFTTKENAEANYSMGFKEDE